MINIEKKIAIIIALVGILMIAVGFTIGLVDKIREERCMNMPVDDIFSDKSCNKYVSKYVERGVSNGKES